MLQLQLVIVPLATRSPAADDACPACGRSEFFIVLAEEILVRRALLSDAKIIAPDTATIHHIAGTAATLRY